MTDNKDAPRPDLGLGGDDRGKITNIESELDQTRSAITGDLKTLGERLSPEHLKQEAKEVMTEAKNAVVGTLHEAKDVATSTYREVKDDALETVNQRVEAIRENVRHAEHEAFSFVRRNALPLGLVGLGVAWFMSNQRSREDRWEGDYSPRGHGRWRYPEPSDSSFGSARDGMTSARDTTREYAHRAGERARDWASRAEHEVGGVASRLQGAAQRELDQGRRLAHEAKDEVYGAARRAKEVTQRELEHAKRFSRETVEMHPLAVGAAALAAGVCVGLLIPETRRESELLGPQRERLLSGAKEAVSQAKQTIDDLQQTAKSTAKDTARDVKNSISGGLTG